MYNIRLCEREVRVAAKADGLRLRLTPKVLDSASHTLALFLEDDPEARKKKESLEERVGNERSLLRVLNLEYSEKLKT